MHGGELWVSDGTTAGTRLMEDIAAGDAGSWPDQFAVFQEKPYFSARTVDAGRELWVSDGTAAGTYRVTDIAAGAASGLGYIDSFWGGRPTFTEAGGLLYFKADDGIHGAKSR